MTFRNIVELDLLDEALKIKKKRWKTDFPGYTVEYNDKLSHDLITRIQDRTDITLSTMMNKISKGIEFVIEKDKKGEFPERYMLDLKFLKSNFRLILLLNPQEKYIRISTIYDISWDSKNTIKLEINESIS